MLPKKFKASTSSFLLSTCSGQRSTVTDPNDLGSMEVDCHDHSLSPRAKSSDKTEKTSPFLYPMVAKKISSLLGGKDLFCLRQISTLYNNTASKRCWDLQGKEFVVDLLFKMPTSDFPAHIYRELVLVNPSKLGYHNVPGNPGRSIILQLAPHVKYLTLMVNGATYTHYGILREIQNILKVSVIVTNDSFLPGNIDPILQALGTSVKNVSILSPDEMIFDRALIHLFTITLQQYVHVEKIGFTGCSVREARTLDLLASNVHRIDRIGLVIRRNEDIFPLHILRDRLESLSHVVEVLGFVAPDEMRHVPWPIFPIEGASWTKLKFLLLTNWGSPLTFLHDFPSLERINLTDTFYETALFVNSHLSDEENIKNIFGNLPGPKKSLHIRHFEQNTGFSRFKNPRILDFLNGNFSFTVWLSWFVQAMIEAHNEEEESMDTSSSELELD